MSHTTDIEMKTDQQFSSTVTVVDAATQQTLASVLLLHGEKLPEFTCRTLFCFTAVQVKVVWVSLSEPNTTCVV